MRRGIVALFSCALSGACLFPSVGDLTGGDASTDVGVEAAGDAASACASVTPDMLAYYTVDEGAGTVVHDCVSSQNDGTILAATHTSWVDGEHGKALELDPFKSVCAAIDFPAPSFTFGGPNAKAFSVAMWLYVIAFPVQGELGYIAGQSSDISAAGWRFSLTSGGVIQLAVPNGTGGVSNIVGSAIAIGAWHHVAAVYAGANSALYVDVKATQQALPASFPADTTSDHMRIGCSSDDQHQLDARIDDVRFYDRALTATDIATLAN